MVARATVGEAQSRAERIEARGRVLWERYRISVEMWFAQYQVQGGLCMWCRRPGNDLGVDSRPQRGRKRQLPMVPDHDHEPPYEWRGLGHPRCNRIAGPFEAALKDPPTGWPGGVRHRVPAQMALALERAAVREAERKRDRRRGVAPVRSGGVPGERTTYRYPDPAAERVPVPADLADTVLAALAELDALQPGGSVGD